jgi:hypothetical protein
MIRFDNIVAEEAMDELKYFVRGRELTIRQLLYRPFFYLAVHTVPMDDVQTRKTRSLAQKALSICVQCNSGHIITHRHHGTWYGLRGNISSGLMLLAARASGLTSNGDDDYQVYEHAFQVCLQMLRYWEAESPADIRHGRQLLETLYAQR